MSQLPVSMEEVVDLLNDVNQQLGESAEGMDEEEEEEARQRGPVHSSPAHPPETSATISHIKFTTTSPNKSLISPSKRHLVSSGYWLSFRRQSNKILYVFLYIKCLLVLIMETIQITSEFLFRISSPF